MSSHEGSVDGSDSQPATIVLPFDREQYPHIEVAILEKQKIARFSDNVLICALPLPEDDDGGYFDSLVLKPDYDPSERQLTLTEKLQQLRGLANFMVPMQAHIKLAARLDTMIREGYVGRAPYTKEHVARYQSSYQRQKSGQRFRQTATTITPQHSEALIGLSGMGKTTTVKRYLARFPLVIYHPGLHVYQVPWLHIQMSRENKSMLSLYTAILQQLDRLIPDVSYMKDYFNRNRYSPALLERGIDYVMNKHHIGLLVVDEVQHLANSPKGKELVMSELVNMCNERKTPLLFIGTKKAHRVLGIDFRQARRSLGPDWDRLVPAEDGQPDGEWERFMSELWQYQWTDSVAPLGKDMLKLFYTCTQGVIDVAIKLFCGAQAHALFEQFECIDRDIVMHVFKTEMTMLHPMIAALESGDYDALMRFEDIAPLDFEEFLVGIERRYTALRSPEASIRPGDPSFAPRLAAAATALGVTPQAAQQAAQEVERAGKAKNPLDGIRQLVSNVTPKRVRRTKGEPGIPKLDLAARPNDYRRAAFAAAEAGTKVVEQLEALGMARWAVDLVPLS